jgi:hypothetical protein
MEQISPEKLNEKKDYLMMIISDNNIKYKFIVTVIGNELKRGQRLVKVNYVSLNAPQDTLEEMNEELNYINKMSYKQAFGSGFGYSKNIDANNDKDILYIATEYFASDIKFYPFHPEAQSKFLKMKKKAIENIKLPSDINTHIMSYLPNNKTKFIEKKFKDQEPSNNLHSIIENSTATPTIVNNNSNFVVVTYWWGRGNLNNNTARPCVSFYEDFTNKIVKSLSDTIIFYKKGKGNIDGIRNKLEILTFEKLLNKIIKQKTTQYFSDVYSYCNISQNIHDKDKKALEYLEKLKENGKTPMNYEYKNKEYIYVLLTFICVEFVKLNKTHILDLFENYEKFEEIKQQFLHPSSSRYNEINKEKLNQQYKNQLKRLTDEKANIKNEIKKNMNVKNTYVFNEDIYKNTKSVTKKMSSLIKNIYDDENIQNKSLNELLVQELRYLNPLKFEEMIDNWQNNCAKHNCNYMAIEYPAFARPGGYQMAINAKPLFIKKALELCGGKSVLYIDGDMNIRKYPVLFDMPDVDYMARSWWMDPRSSYKMDESITYDPYTFETSGGTMFFSNSEQAHFLLNAWIYESGKLYQQGKADDRIISMIFNTKKLLLDMKIIELPIEYLWLTLDYDDRLMETVYDYNKTAMDSTIIIDHPECLTSEDTASGSGASSDRTPKFYNFFDYILDPVSENYYEYLAFPDKKFKDGLSTYLNYMGDVYYIDDGNEELYKKGFVTQGADMTDNEQPLYVTPFDKKFGNKNEISEIISKKANNMLINGLYKYNSSHNLAEIEEVDFFKEDGVSVDTVKILALIHRLMNDGKNVLYKPSTTNSELYNQFKNKLNSKYKNTEFAFVPIFTGKNYNDMFRPQIDLQQCIYFTPFLI